MKSKCPICYTQYNERESSPRIIPLCGHTICLACVEKLTKVVFGCLVLKCPICNLKFKTDSDCSDCDIEEVFPQNYALKERIEQEKTRNLKTENCVIHGKKIFMLCLDEQCTQPRKCCVTCTRQIHSECDDECLLPLDQIGKKIPIQKYKNKKAYYKDALRKVIETFKSSFRSHINSMYQNYKTSLNDFRVSNSNFDPDDSSFDPYSFELIKRSVDDIAVRPYNIEEFEERENDASILEGILEEIDNELASKCADFMVNSFKRLQEARRLKKQLPEVVKNSANPAEQQSGNLTQTQNSERNNSTG